VNVRRLGFARIDHHLVHEANQHAVGLADLILVDLLRRNRIVQFRCQVLDLHRRGVEPVVQLHGVAQLVRRRHHRRDRHPREKADAVERDRIERILDGEHERAPVDAKRHYVVFRGDRRGTSFSTAGSTS
jgi:hypothetical protein